MTDKHRAAQRIEQTAQTPAAPHQVILQDRRTLSVSGVADVDSFDEETVVLLTSMGELTVKGSQLHVQKLNVETGDAVIEGAFDSLEYSEVQQRSRGSLWGRLFS
ncbi:MAG: sporulation protein YabP [Oscillospiraceae bacterium]|nr:sporulation protein YabP [Oscillospiraceae bacterium]